MATLAQQEKRKLFKERQERLSKEKLQREQTLANAAIRIQKVVRGRQARNAVEQLRSSGLLSRVKLKERFREWLEDRRRVRQPGYAVAMLSVRQRDRERQSHPWKLPKNATAI